MQKLWLNHKLEQPEVPDMSHVINKYVESQSDFTLKITNIVWLPCSVCSHWWKHLFSNKCNYLQTYDPSWGVVLFFINPVKFITECICLQANAFVYKSTVAMCKFYWNLNTYFQNFCKICNFCFWQFGMESIFKILDRGLSFFHVNIVDATITASLMSTCCC